MKTNHPQTRTEANQPQAVEHLSADQQQALEKGGEAEHASGPQRERLTQDSKNLGEKGAR